MRDEVKAREMTIAMDYQPAGWPGEALAKAKRGDLAAFEELISRYERSVFRIAFGILGRREDAEDAAQEVFLRLHRFLGTLDHERAFAPWIYRVTVNVCRDLHEKRSRRAGLSLEELDSTGFEARTSEPDPEAQLSSAEQQKWLELALRSLPPKERAALILRDIEGLSTEEVAGILGSAPATVRSQVSTARIKLKRYRDRLSGREKL